MLASRLPVHEVRPWRVWAQAQAPSATAAPFLLVTLPRRTPARPAQVHGQLRRLKLSANYACMVAFAEPLGAGFEGAFIEGSPVLSWAANNTAKLGGGAAPCTGAPECWTLISTQEYGAANKVPQENMPAEVRERVAAEMLAELAACLGRALPPAVYTRVQLWGAALPQTSPSVPCIWDPESRTGVVGDWVAGGGSMQAAALSGASLAETICSMRGLTNQQAARLLAGLAEAVMPVGGTPIGQFPCAGD